MKLIIILLLLVGNEISGGSAGCSVSIKDLKTYQPLFLQPGTSTTWPISNIGSMEFSDGQRLELYCSSTYSNPSGKSGSQYATCDSGKTFQISNIKYDLTDVLCSRWPVVIARNTGHRCKGGDIIESGFTVGTRFVRQMEICFNETLEVTRYVSHTLGPGIKHSQSNLVRPGFAKSGFFGKKNVDELYKQRIITVTLNQQLGNMAKYDSNIIRGHIASAADFVYASHQRGTFLFVNVAPQWQSINNGNWKKLEDNTRAWVVRTNKNVNCYSGVYGVTTLPDVSNVQTPVYLAFDNNGNGLIPIPMLFFRVIIEPSTNKGVVLITVNNPRQVLPNYRVCPDVSHQLTWLTWRKHVVREGFSYACEVDAFAGVNPYLPKFNVRGLLV